jgi:hypothetical protein
VPHDRIGLLYKGKRLERSEWDVIAHTDATSSDQSTSPVNRPLLMLIGTPAPSVLPLYDRVVSTMSYLGQESWSMWINLVMIIMRFCIDGFGAVLLFLESANPWGEHAIAAPPNRGNEQRARRNAELAATQQAERLNGQIGENTQWNE